MDWKNLALDWLTDERRKTLWHKEDGVCYVESRQDAEPIVEFVKNKAQMPQDKDFKFVGSVPMTAVNQALIEGWADDMKQWRKYLADNPKFSADWHK